MEHMTLGKTGRKVSRLGFGGIPIQRIDTDAAAALMESVGAAGIDYIDTARGYTVSEELIGGAIAGRRSRFILATKSMARDKKGMAADIETSLKNLRTDFIDVYQVHNPTMEQLDTVCGPDGALEALLEAKAAGKIGHIGLTAHSLKVFAHALDLEWVETIMFPYNIVENQGAELIEEAQRRNIGFIAMKPMAGGAIEDTALALRYVIANPAVTVVIPGMFSPREVEENLTAIDNPAPLLPDELERIEAIRKELGNAFCRRCNYCAPCTAGIQIPNVFLFQGYLRRYGLEQWARDRYAGLSAKASACVDCGACETRCPYHLPIREMLRQAAVDFGV